MYLLKIAKYKRLISIFTENFNYEMVVLVNEGADIKNLDDLKGKRLCHPGLFEGEAGYGWSNLMSQVRLFTQ